MFGSALPGIAICGYAHICMSSNIAMDLRPMARLLKALGDETRLRIVALLTQGELCVCSFQEILDVPQPAVSRQLAVLRAAQVVATSRQGSWIYYRLADQDDAECARQIKNLCAQFSNRKLMKRDLERLFKVRARRDCD
jgi:ArsR family transcriptional regulator